MLRTTQKLQAYAPLLVHGNPKKVLQIGFGSGETSGVGLAFGVDQYSIVEICPGVFEAGKFFEQINRGSYKDPRLRKIIMDGKNFVKLTEEKFDIIMNDSTYPGTTGSSALYTYDHFKQCRDRLEPGGVLSCWVPLDLRPEDFSIIVRSFQAVMPHSSLWMVNNCLNKHAVLMGTLSPMRIDFQRMKKLVERPDILTDLAVINIHSVYELLDCFVVGEDGLRNIGGDGPLNTDDKPSLEFGAAIKRDNEKCWIDIFVAMSRNHSRISENVVNTGPTDQDKQQATAAMDRYFSGTHHALLGLLAILEGNPEAMNREFEAAQKVNPEDRDVESCLNEMKLEIAALAEAVQQTPGDASLRSRLAKRYLLLRDYQSAAEQYEQFVGLEPGNAAGWNNLGICYNKSEQFDKAIWAFEKAIEHDPRQVHGYVNVASVYSKRGDWEKASEKLKKAVLISSPSDKALIYDKLARS
ncbi:MAG: tetratricopeptide repeat protein, partial [Planctomycetota bacterium]|nr:tetratricopeptide repeat protein [Planctomycetota bacterium]